MLPRDADAAVQLHGVLDDLGCPLAHVGLGHAGQLGAAAGVLLHGAGGAVGGGEAGLDPQLEVGVAVLQRLVRGERPSEGVAVEGVLDGHLEDPVGGARHLGAQQHQGDLELVVDLGGGAADRADDRRRRDGHPVEAHLGEAAHEVEAVERRDRDARRVGGDEELGRAGVGPAPSRGAGRPGRPPRPSSWCRRARSRRRRPGRPARPDRPATGRRAPGRPTPPPRRRSRCRGGRPRRCSALPAAGEHRRHDVGGQERPRRHEAAELLGHDRQVAHAGRRTRCRRRAPRAPASTSSPARRPVATSPGRSRRGRARAPGPPSAASPPRGTSAWSPGTVVGRRSVPGPTRPSRGRGARVVAVRA